MLVFNGEDVQHLVDDGGLFKKRKTFIDKTSEVSEHNIYTYFMDKMVASD